MALTGSDVLNLGVWLGDLTYAEIHAMAFGTIHATLINVALLLTVYGVPWAETIALGLVALVFYFTGIISKRKAIEYPVVGRALNYIPKTLRGQIRDENHYYGGAGIAVFVVEAAVLVAFLLGWFPV